MYRTKLISVGKKQPEKTLDNMELMKMVETDNDWIIERTGIERRQISTTEMLTDLAAAAAEEALEKDFSGNKINKDDIDIVVVATVTPDKVTPYTAAVVKKKLGLKNARCFDINAACSGFVYSLWMVDSIMKAEGLNKAIVIGSDRLSRITDYTDRNTCILFGDGAGAAVLELVETDNPKVGIQASAIINYDDVDNALTCGIEYPDNPFAEEEVETMFLKMRGTKVFKFAVKAVCTVMDEVFEKTGYSPDDVDFYVPHQANMRIITAAAKTYKQPIEKFQVSIQDTGNVSSASIPMALYDLMNSDKTKGDELIMLAGFGGGLSSGAVLIQL
ncbi:MAG: 3-oxoacyl-ACP synthase III family protein [Anaerovoracaceae bacterium]